MGRVAFGRDQLDRWGAARLSGAALAVAALAVAAGPCRQRQPGIHRLADCRGRGGRAGVRGRRGSRAGRPRRPRVVCAGRGDVVDPFAGYSGRALPSSGAGGRVVSFPSGRPRGPIRWACVALAVPVAFHLVPRQWVPALFVAVALVSLLSWRRGPVAAFYPSWAALAIAHRVGVLVALRSGGDRRRPGHHHQRLRAGDGIGGDRLRRHHPRARRPPGGLRRSGPRRRSSRRPRRTGRGAPGAVGRSGPDDPSVAGTRSSRHRGRWCTTAHRWPFRSRLATDHRRRDGAGSHRLPGECTGGRTDVLGRRQGSAVGGAPPAAAGAVGGSARRAAGGSNAAGGGSRPSARARGGPLARGGRLSAGPYGGRAARHRR